MGLLGTVGHFMLILAYYRAPAATLTPYLYSQIAFAMIGGVIVFSHVPDNLSHPLGTGMIAFCGAAGAWLAVREQRAARLNPMAQYFELHPDNPQPRLLKQAVAILMAAASSPCPRTPATRSPATWTTRRRPTGCGRSAGSTSTTSRCCAGT